MVPERSKINQKRGYLLRKSNFFKNFLIPFPATTYKIFFHEKSSIFRIKPAGMSYYGETSSLVTSFDKFISPIHFEKPVVACAIGARRGRVNQNEQKMQNEPNF